VIQIDPWITNFLLLVMSSHKSRFGVREAGQWDCPRFTYVVRTVQGSDKRTIDCQEQSLKLTHHAGSSLSQPGKKAVDHVVRQDLVSGLRRGRHSADFNTQPDDENFALLKTPESLD
jgi:hypothetical protein